MNKIESMSLQIIIMKKVHLSLSSFSEIRPDKRLYVSSAKKTNSPDWKAFKVSF